MELTYSQAEKLLRYSKQSGDIYWSVNRQGRVKAGDKAGTLQLNKNGKSYISIVVSQKHYLAHRLVWLLENKEFPNGCIDHINGNGLDNRIENLRVVSRLSNQRNQRLSKRSKSGVMGVSRCHRSGKWVVRIGSRSTQKYIGLYSDFFEAVCARKSEERNQNYHLNHGQTRPL